MKSLELEVRQEMDALQRKLIRAISNAVGAASVFDVRGVSSRDLYFRRILGSNRS